MKLTKKRIGDFQDFIFDWWTTNRRDLPWRRTRDPYKILISEVMLQQTQVSRVLPKYKEFLQSFPNARSLASASTASVLRAWKGMGYNRRALYLKRAATIGTFPKSEKELIKLPGLGTYTARAILVFAFEQDVPLIDTNIRQIITQFFFKGKPQKESVIEGVAQQLLPRGKSWEWHQALMDYGALALKKTRGIVKKQKQFKDSDRFYRGRIIDLLREKNYKEARLLAHLSSTYEKPTFYFKKVITGLIRDNLISSSRNGIISLPE